MYVLISVLKSLVWHLRRSVVVRGPEADQVVRTGFDGTSASSHADRCPSAPQLCVCDCVSANVSCVNVYFVHYSAAAYFGSSATASRLFWAQHHQDA